MSEERRQRQQVREREEQPKSRRIIVIAVLIVLAFSLVVYFLRRNHVGRLDAFAQCLTAKQAKMYGAYWCPHCSEQKEMFDSSFAYAPYVECGIKGSHALEPICTQKAIQRFPTWIFADGTRVEGKQELDFLSEKTGCALP
jgi:hypothetical protein